jgi:transposase
MLDDCDRMVNPDNATLSHSEISKPKYIDHSLTVKMRAGGMTCQEIADVQGCSKTNIVNVLQRYDAKKGEVEDFKRHRADILAAMQQRILRNVTAEDIAKAPLSVKLLSMGIAYDKERLERGKATNISVSAKLEMTEKAYEKMIRRKYGEIIDAPGEEISEDVADMAPAE